MSHRILVLSNFFPGRGGTRRLLLAGELAACGVAVDVFCKKGLLRDAQMCDALPAMDDGAAFSSVTPDTRSYAALFIAGSWNSVRAPDLRVAAPRWGRLLHRFMLPRVACAELSSSGRATCDAFPIFY